MTTDVSPATDVAAALTDGLAAAKAEGAKSVRAQHLTPEQFDTLAGATLAHLRTRPGKPSHIETWSLVTARDAGVTAWWAEVAGLTDTERRRLGKLRREVYASLAERDLIATDTEKSTSVHVSPTEAPVTEAPVTEAAVTEADQTPVDAFGAWVLKLSPYVYDVHRVFAAPDRKVRVWSVDDAQRAADMQYGQPVYLWVDEGDPYREAGVWGVGWIAGPCMLGIPDEGWLDVEAATRANVFAVVEVTLLDAPVSRDAFLEDARLADAEVLRDPYGPNPGVLSTVEASALAEHLGSQPEQSETWVA